VATGEIGPKPSIYVWNSTTMEVKCQFKAVIAKGIAALAFSPSGKRLVAAAIDDDHWVAVMDVTGTGSVIGKVKGGKDVMISLAFNTEDVIILIFYLFSYFHDKFIRNLLQLEINTISIGR